jgi:16S rRNA (cytosine1402-N4)-methyltransferase
VVHYRFAVKSYARIFQSLRIAVNNELENLTKALLDSIQFLKQGGRLVIISYHSLEDRIVKNFLKEKANPCICPPEFPECVCGLKPEIRILTRKVIRPDRIELQKNPRSRSALLRVGERL